MTLDSFSARRAPTGSKLKRTSESHGRLSSRPTRAALLLPSSIGCAFGGSVVANFEQVETTPVTFHIALTRINDLLTKRSLVNEGDESRTGQF